MKKIISLFIALCIALSLSVPVFAATSDSPITISSEDVITHSTPIPAPTITLRKSAPQVTALELYDYGWIEGTDHWGVIIKVIKPLSLLHISMIVAPLQSLAHIRSKPLMFPPTGRIRKSPFPLTLLLRLPTTHDKRYCYVSAAHSFLSPYDEKLYSKF